MLLSEMNYKRKFWIIEGNGLSQSDQKVHMVQYSKRRVMPSYFLKNKNKYPSLILKCDLV